MFATNGRLNGFSYPRTCKNKKKIVSSYATNRPKTQKVKKIKTKQTSNFIATFLPPPFFCHAHPSIFED